MSNVHYGFNEAWQVTRATKPENHHEKCSYRTHGMLCDCAAFYAGAKGWELREDIVAIDQDKNTTSRLEIARRALPDHVVIFRPHAEYFLRLIEEMLPENHDHKHQSYLRSIRTVIRDATEGR